MQRKAAAIAIALTVALGLPAVGFAKGHDGGSGGHSGPSLPSGFHEGAKVGWGHGHRPPGWSEGEKTGWGRGHIPPGLRRH